MKYVVGLDYGTDSCRAVIVEAETGAEVASSEKFYKRWKEGKYCDPLKNRYRQHPLDYIESLEESVREALSLSPEGTAENVVGISFDTTGCTPALVNADGLPLALMPEHAEKPDAMFVLWKDHTAIEEAARINELAKAGDTDYTAYEGGIYSSEWVWAKMAHVLSNDESIRGDAYSWVEHCDWMPALLAGKTRPEVMVRSRCAAGHKAMWHKDWDGLPPEEFLVAVSPLLKGFRARLFEETYTSDVRVGNLTPEWATRLGLSTDVAVGVGMFDCHAGAVGAEIKPKNFVRVMGTSTCDVMVVPYEDMRDKLIPGICGQVDGSVIPGMIGLEAGQSGFGDVYAWVSRFTGKSIRELTAEAEKLPISETIVATDWLNGRRTPDADQLLTGTITGLTLSSSPAMVFRALVEATAYGSKAIIDRFLENGIEIESVTGIGGIARKSPFVMQTLADVLGMPIKVAKTEQACAFGAAMFAAVAAGVHPDVPSAQKAMGQGFISEYLLNETNHRIYAKMYEKYLALGHFNYELRITNYESPSAGSSQPATRSSQLDNL
ncbi:MAG: ribulokinase [Prevotellaceae bacterium]|jgi:L-ribulokinase|nr:ribulokinase [Prevotellaceae bacterium]